MSKAKLKPCPFCGSKEEDFRKHPETCFLYRISKQNKTECMAYCKEDCEWAWNKRALLKSEPVCKTCGGNGVAPVEDEDLGGHGVTNNPCPDCKPTGVVAELKKGCVVFMKASSGLVGYGNAQCVSEVHHESLGTISLYGHNQHYKTYDIDKIVKCPDDQLEAQLKASKQEADVMWEGLNGSIAELQAGIAKLKANGNDVVCGDHWDGLSGEMIDGNTGCPWCIIEKLTGEKQTIEAELSTAKAEIKGLRALCSESLAVFGEGDQSCEVVVISRKLDQALQGQDGGE